MRLGWLLVWSVIPITLLAAVGLVSRATGVASRACRRVLGFIRLAFRDCRPDAAFDLRAAERWSWRIPSFTDRADRIPGALSRPILVSISTDCSSRAPTAARRIRG